MTRIRFETFPAVYTEPSANEYFPAAYLGRGLRITVFGWRFTIALVKGPTA